MIVGIDKEFKYRLAGLGAILSFSSLALSSCAPSVSPVEAAGPAYLPDEGARERISVVTPDPTELPLVRVVVAPASSTATAVPPPDILASNSKEPVSRLRYPPGSIIYQGDPKINSNQIALTLDDSCQPATVKKTLTMLQENKAKVTFFFPVADLPTNPALYQEIEKSGHEIGLHGWNHEDFAKFTDFPWARELHRRQVEAYTAVLGHKPRFMRFPFGSVGDQQHRKWANDILTEFGLIAIGWNKTFGDSGSWPNPADLIDFERKVVDKLRPADIVLGHCRAVVTGTLYPEHIQKLIKNGIYPATLSQFLAAR